MSNEERRNAVVSLAVYPDTKDEWEDAVQEDPNTDPLSQLVRVAVSQSLHNDSESFLMLG